MWNPLDMLADHIWDKHIYPALDIWDDDDYALARHLIDSTANKRTPTHADDCQLAQPNNECSCNQPAHRETT
jgi:hypothetical protein